MTKRNLAPLAVSLALLQITALGETVFTDGFAREFKLSAPMSASEADKVEPKLATGKLDAIPWSDISGVSPRINFNRLFPGKNLDGATVFVAMNVEISKSMEGLVTVGSDDGMKLFINGRLLKAVQGPRSCVPDGDQVKAQFHQGANRLLLRVDNGSGNFEAIMRVALSSARQEGLANWFQRPKSSSPPEQRLNNASYRYFTAPPATPRDGPPKVRHGIMSGTQKEAHAFYSKYCDGGIMPSPDILELRAPLYSIYDARGGKPSPYLANALEAAAKSNAPQVELSPLYAFFIGSKTNPEVAPDIAAFYNACFKGSPPAPMLDASGRPASANNRYCFSLHAPRNRGFVRNAATETAKLLRAHPEWRGAGINFRFPGNNDWYYPIDNGFYDYSTPAQDAFRKFLRGEYGSIAKLNAAYGSAHADFNELDAPLPPFGTLDLSRRWQDWQAFRVETVTDAQRDIFKAIREADPDREIVSWMTTAVYTASRDGIVLDNAMLLEREFPNTLETLTCFDYSWLPGELFGQLALAYGVGISIEPNGAGDSYLRTFFNALRFPVKKANWLFFIAEKPAEAPWVIWVMNQRGVVDELADAELIQDGTACLFPYSDALLQVPARLWDKQPVAAQIDLLKALQSSNFNLPMLSDYTLSPPLGKHRGLLVADCKLIRPEMIAKLGALVRDGGKALVVGASGEYNLETGKQDYPLLRELGVDSASVRRGPDGLRLTQIPRDGAIAKERDNLVVEASWALGKGEVVFHGPGVASLLGQDGNLNAEAKSWMEAQGIKPLLRMEKDGLVGTFVKAKGRTRYLGFININGGAFTTTAEFTPAANMGKLMGTELISGDKVELDNGRFQLNFDIPWQVKVIKIELDENTWHWLHSF